jgi:hypothetical protein
MRTEAENRYLGSVHDLYEENVCKLIKEVVSTYYGFDLSVFDTKKRDRQIIKAKQAAVYFIRKSLPKASLQRIGNIMNYDHASILHVLKKVNELMETEVQTRTEIKELETIMCMSNGTIDLGKKMDAHYYYVNLNDCISVKLHSGKSIVLSGYSLEEANHIVKNGVFELTASVENNAVPIEHKKTRLHILQKITKENKDENN